MSDNRRADVRRHHDHARSRELHAHLADVRTHGGIGSASWLSLPKCGAARRLTRLEQRAATGATMGVHREREQDPGKDGGRW